MCMFCYAMCDKCKPAEQKVFTCKSCGKARILTRDECLCALGYPEAVREEAREKLPTGTILCANCGADLTALVTSAIRPRACSYSGITCAYPCKRSERARSENDKPCEKQVVAKSELAVA